MTTLNKYHPFRESVIKTNEGTQTTEKEVSSDKESKDFEYKPWLSFKTKMRLVIGCVSCVAVWFVINSFIGENPELKEGFYSTMGGSSGKKSNRNKEESTNSIFDEHDLDERGRSISDAKSKAGFLSSLFCKGGKKASFCD